MSEANEDDKTKVTLKVHTLPSTVQTAQRELARLHVEREPYNEQLKRITKEMEISKAILKTFCLEQKEEMEKTGLGTIAQTTYFEEEDMTKNPIRVNCVAKTVQPVPTAEDVYSVTGQLLNTFGKQLLQRVLLDLSTDHNAAQIYQEHRSVFDTVIRESLKFSTMQLLSDIRKESSRAAGPARTQYSIGMTEAKPEKSKKRKITE